MAAVTTPGAQQAWQAACTAGLCGCDGPLGLLQRSVAASSEGASASNGRNQMNVSRPVVAFALLRQSSDLLRTDLLGGVAILIRPLVTDLSGQLYDADVL